MSFSACPHFHAYLSSPWFYMTVSMKVREHLRYKLTGGSHDFSSWENKSCIRSICTDICAEVSGYFHPNFQYKLKREHKASFPEIFPKCLGFFSTIKAKFVLKENVTSIFWPQRQVPFTVLAIIDNELEWLEKLGVIEKTDYSPWANSTVYVKKKKKIRVVEIFRQD